MATAINVHVFSHDGRGPSLQEVHFKPRTAQIVAIDYVNWNVDDDSPGALKHVYFVAPQVVQITPEEVIGGDQIPPGIIMNSGGAMFDMGCTDWLRSFDQRHLANCRHYKLLFYDELFDVICEGIECRGGGFEASGE